jgi:hypothetical protein
MWAEGQNGKAMATNPPQCIFAGVHRLKMANRRIPFAGWQNCKAPFSYWQNRHFLLWRFPSEKNAPENLPPLSREDDAGLGRRNPDHTGGNDPCITGATSS